MASKNTLFYIIMTIIIVAVICLFMFDCKVSCEKLPIIKTIDDDQCCGNATCGIWNTCSQDSDCSNGGTCTTQGNFNYCTCANNWTGTCCNRKRTCGGDDDCLNDGYCVGPSAGNPGGYCSCARGWTGSNCQTKSK
jgi:hypothetical protein